MRFIFLYQTKIGDKIFNKKGVEEEAIISMENKIERVKSDNKRRKMKMLLYI